MTRTSKLKRFNFKTMVIINSYFSCLRGVRSSPSYWAQQEKKIMAMLRQLGVPTFFITLSAAESHWPELLVILMKTVHGRDINEEAATQLTSLEKASLIRSDPVTCARYFDHRYRCLFNNLFTKPGGIFRPHRVTDNYQRVEMQLRGSPHSHALHWLDGNS